MSILEFIGYVTIFGAGFFAGEAVMAMRFRNILQSLIEDELQVPDTVFGKEVIDVRKLTVEHWEGLLYLYEAETKHFVCQGKTMDDLAKLAKENSNISYAAVQDDTTLVWFIDGVVKSTP